MKHATNLLIALALTLPLARAKALSFNASTCTVESGPVVVTAADINGDGRPDLICPSFGYRNDLPGTPGGWNTNLIVLTNNGSGGFGYKTTLHVGTGPCSVAAADVNGDGKVDLISANNSDNTLTILTNAGSGFFGFNATLPVGLRPQCVVAADINLDGRPDLVTANNGTNTLTVLTNGGNAQFGLNATLTAGTSPYTVVAVDVNGDGKTDLACVNQGSDNVSVFANNGAGVFSFTGNYSVGHLPDCLVSADFNHDAWPDLVAVNWSDNTLTVLTNNRAGSYGLNATLSAGSYAYPSSVAAADFDGNGSIDLICAITGGTANKLTVLTNNGVGVFAYQTTLTVGNIPNVTLADLNNDGKPDLICPNFLDGTVTVLLNNTSFPQSFVSTYDTDADGWTGIDVQGPPYDVVTRGPYALNWLSSGGDPGGRVGTTDTDATLFCFSAPAKFLGAHANWYGGSLRYELRFQNDSLAPGFLHPDVILMGGGYTLVAKAGTDPLAQTDVWLPFQVTFNEANWHLANLAGQNPTTAQLKAALSDLTALYIRGDYFSGLDTAWLDNVVAALAQVQIQSPQFAGTNFTFTLSTVIGQSYTVQHNDDLKTSNWIFYTNFTGNGSLMQVFAPITSTPQRFYRVRQP